MQARKYNGKEWVEAFGYDNYLFGARDYYSAIGRFTVVDPFAEKYAHISPYAYCHWNPMRYVDPDRKRVFFAPDVSEAFKKDFKQAVTYMNQKGISGMLYQLEKSPNIYYLSEGIGVNGSEFDSNTNTIKWFSRVGLITDNLYEMSPVEILNHEIDHALQHDINPIQQKKDHKTKDSNQKSINISCHRNHLIKMRCFASRIFRQSN